jgi:hypothetical protein
MTANKTAFRVSARAQPLADIPTLTILRVCIHRRALFSPLSVRRKSKRNNAAPRDRALTFNLMHGAALRLSSVIERAPRYREDVGEKTMTITMTERSAVSSFSRLWLITSTMARFSPSLSLSLSLSLFFWPARKQ